MKALREALVIGFWTVGRWIVEAIDRLLQRLPKLDA